jgi:uncharacterized membrane protein
MFIYMHNIDYTIKDSEKFVISNEQLIEVFIYLIQSGQVIDEFKGLPFTEKELIENADVIIKDLKTYSGVYNGQELIDQRLYYIRNNYMCDKNI